MDDARIWREFFQTWPSQLGQSGVLVTTFDEQIPFGGFLTSDNVLLLERRAPDAVGARKVILTYGSIASVKIVDPVKSKVFTAAGFTGSLANKK